jgi:hypothetical protein
MSEPILPDLVITRSFTDKGRRGVKQAVTCDVPGCDNEMVTTATNGLKPGDQVLNMARRRGWVIDNKHGRVCPRHKGRDKPVTPEQVTELAGLFKAWLDQSSFSFEDRKKVLISELGQLGIGKVTEVKTESQRKALLALLNRTFPREPDMAQKNPELVAASQGLVPLSESLKLPSDAARAQRRKVFHEIEGCYAQGRYVEGFSDETIAKKLLVAVGMVTEVREMNFGPAGPGPRIKALRDEMAALEVRVNQIEEAALAVMDQAEKKAIELRRDIASLLSKIIKLEGSL